MSNCIDCVWVFSCKEANEDKKQCEHFINAHRKIVHLDMDYKKEVEEMLQ